MVYDVISLGRGGVSGMQFPTGDFAHFSGPDNAQMMARHLLSDIIDSGRADKSIYFRKGKLQE